MSSYSSNKNQYIATIIANGAGFAGGLSFGWSSPINAQIIADDNGNCMHDFCVSKSEMAAIASFLSVGSLGLGFIAGPLMSCIGRKLAMIAYFILTVAGWISLTFAEDSFMLFTGRFLVGAGFGGACVILPIYIGEIADTAIRGKLCSTIQTTINAGLLVSYIAGYFYPIFIQNAISLFIVGVFAVALFFIPESPAYLVYVNRIEDAKVSLKWLRGDRFNPEKLIEEVIDFQNNQESKGFKSVLTEKVNRKALFITGLLILALQFSGLNPIIFFTATIFKDANVSIEPDLAVIFVGIFSLIATIISSLLVDKAGRKILLYISFSVMFICLATIGVYFNLAATSPELVQQFSLVPVIMLCLYVFTNMVGACSVVWVVIGEIFAQNIKDVASGIVNCWSFILSITVSLLFPFLAHTFGFDVTFVIFSGFIAISFFMVMFFVPETKGKSFQEIQNMFSKINK